MRKKKSKKVKRTKIYRATHLTISLPDDIAKYVKEQKNYSGYIARLIQQDKEKELTAPKPTPASSEELEIRQALKERNRLIQIYGVETISDLEHVINDGGIEDEKGKWQTVKDWAVFMEEKGIIDEKGYFKTYAKYQTRSEDIRLWIDLKFQIADENEREHKARLKQEIGGLTLQEIIDRLDAYLKLRFDKKRKELKTEIAEIDGVPDRDLDYNDRIKRDEIHHQIGALQKKLESKEVSMKDLTNALGLPYMEIYNRVAPALRREGYKVT